MIITLAIMAGKGAEAAQLARAIHSAREYVDKVYLMDTGLEQDIFPRFDDVYRTLSSDTSASPRFIISNMPWTDDFGDMRTKLIKRAAASTGCEWVLMLDSDESIACSMLPQDFRSFLSNIDRDSRVEAVHIQHFSNTYGQPRLFRTPILGHFEGKTHEAYVLNMSYAHCPAMKFVDYDRPLELWQAKFERDLRVLKADIEKEPSARKHFYLAETYRNTHDHINAAKHYLECVKTSTWNEERAWASYRCAVELSELGDWIKALQVTVAGLEFMPAMPELPWYAGYCCSKMNRHGESVAWGLMAAALNDRTVSGIDAPERVLFKHLPALKEGPWDLLRHGYRNIGDTQRADNAQAMWEILTKGPT
jgi:hypothetical protein